MDNKNVSPFSFIGSQITHLDFDSSVLLFDETTFKKSFNVNQEIIRIDSDDKNRYGEVEMKIDVDVNDEQPDDNNQKAIIHLTIEGAFSAPVEMNDDQFVSMMKINGAAALYSIARGFLTSVTSQSFLNGQIILPLANFFPNSFNKE